jgi:hypothetical protein
MSWRATWVGRWWPAGRFAAGLRLAFVALIVFATGGPTVQAEDEFPAAFFRADRERLRQIQQRASPLVVQRPTHLIRRGAPVRGFARVTPGDPNTAPVDPNAAGANPSTPGDATAADPAAPSTPATDTPPAAPVIAAPADKPTSPKPVEANFFVLVVGDSLGQMLGQGLTEAFADRPEVSILRKARENTGLVRDDYFDWNKGVNDLLATSGKINIAVMMIGSNDRQALREGANAYDARQPRWREIYGDRVEAIAKAFRDRKIPLVWVGLPVMKNDRFSADMAAFNEIYQERAAKAGATYIDTWEAFLDDRGQFAAYGPDVNGQFQKLRAGDGVHFTRAGARKLAHFVEGDIRHAIEDSRPAVDPMATVIPVVAPVAPSLSPAAPAVAPPGPVVVALPAPAAPPEVVIPVKPEAGVAVSLTGPAVASDGTLATRGPRSTLAGSRALVDRALVQGQPLEARPGRADDFRWPRN